MVSSPRRTPTRLRAVDRARLVERGVDRRGHDLEAREHVVGVVEAPVGPDLDLGPDEDAERRQLLIELGDLLRALRALYQKMSDQVAVRRGTAPS